MYNGSKSATEYSSYRDNSPRVRHYFNHYIYMSHWYESMEQWVTDKSTSNILCKNNILLIYNFSGKLYVTKTPRKVASEWVGGLQNLRMADCA